MMKYVFNSLLALTIAVSGGVCNALQIDEPIAIDSRIKTFVYSENEIFPVILNYGYQTAIEFGKDESIQTYSVGNQFVWQFSAVGRTLFIKPLEDNIVTNMTVLTNKRRYYFELYSKISSAINDEDISYVVRFFYPENNEKPTVAPQATIGDNIDVIKPYNFDYTISGDQSIISTAFDNGVNTFLKTNKIKPSFISCDNRNIKAKLLDEYVVLPKVCKTINVEFGSKKIVVKSIK